MKRLLFILVLLLPVLLSCNKSSVDGEEPTLGVYIETPADSFTKAEVGEFTGAAAENAVHNIFVWIFLHDTRELLETLDLTGSQLPSPGRVRRYDIAVSRDFAREKPAVDVFAIANRESIACTLDENSSWSEINDAVFTNPYFGVANVTVEVDPSKGLPMTGAGRGLAIQGEEPMLKVETVTLVRAVSRLRYVFCKMANEHEQDQISITGVTLDGYKIPVSEYLFLSSQTQKYHIVTAGAEEQDQDFEPQPIVTGPLPALMSNETPEKMVYAGQDAAAYEAMLNDAIEAGTLTDGGVTYLRESSRTLTGKVDYVINGEPGSKSFAMASRGDFARNHNWTVYGYFLSGRNLQLTTRVLPWDYGAWTINFSDKSVTATQWNVDRNTVEVVSLPNNHFDCYLRPGTTARCSFYITNPVSGKLMIRVIGDSYAFVVTPRIVDINPDVDGGRVEIGISRNLDVQGDLSGKFIRLSFAVELGPREIDADSEIYNNDEYRFIL